MIVHACHCTRCQQRTGCPMAVNLWIEQSRIKILGDEPAKQGESVDENGNASSAWGCAKCGTSVWTIYHAAVPGAVFLRAGLLENPSAFPPDVHIFTRSKQPWMSIPDDVPSFETYYDFKTTWSKESMQRFRALKESGRAT